MNLPVYVHPRVEEFLDENASWWGENHSSEQAERWYDGFVRAILSLEENPQSRPLAAENDEFPFEMRELHFGIGNRPTHRALFTIRPDKVYVLMLRHAAQAPVTIEDLE